MKGLRRRRGDEGQPAATADGVEADAGGKKRRRRRRLAKDRRVEAVGIAIIAFGCLCTALVWIGVRDSNNVAFQLPIIASGGLVAVGCFIVGGLLVVGGLVMTRFARLEAARAALGDPGPPPPAPPDGRETEVSLAEERV